MLFAFAGQNPVAHYGFGDLQAFALLEVILLGNEHFFDLIGIGQQVNMALRTKAKMNDLAMLGDCFTDKLERVFAKSEQVPGNRQTSWSCECHTHLNPPHMLWLGYG